MYTIVDQPCVPYLIEHICHDWPAIRELFPAMCDVFDQPCMTCSSLMFWTDWGRHPVIQRSWMDGTNKVTIIRHNLVWPNGLTIDYVLDQLYWVDAKMNTIQSADLNGSRRSVYVSDFVSSYVSSMFIDSHTEYPNDFCLFLIPWNGTTSRAVCSVLPLCCSISATLPSLQVSSSSIFLKSFLL